MGISRPHGPDRGREGGHGLFMGQCPARLGGHTPFLPALPAAPSAGALPVHAPPYACLCPLRAGHALPFRALPLLFGREGAPRVTRAGTPPAAPPTSPRRETRSGQGRRGAQGGYGRRRPGFLRLTPFPACRARARPRGNAQSPVAGPRDCHPDAGVRPCHLPLFPLPGGTGEGTPAGSRSLAARAGTPQGAGQPAFLHEHAQQYTRDGGDGPGQGAGDDHGAVETHALRAL